MEQHLNLMEQQVHKKANHHLNHKLMDYNSMACLHKQWLGTDNRQIEANCLLLQHLELGLLLNMLQEQKQYHHLNHHSGYICFLSLNFYSGLPL